MDEDGTHLLRCNQIKLDELVASTDRELLTNARFLQRRSARFRPREFRQLQQAIGLTYAPHGLLLDQYVDRLISPTDAYMHDYMHALFVDGVINLTIYLCFEECIKAGQVGVYESVLSFAAIGSSLVDSMLIICRRSSQVIVATSTVMLIISSVKQAIC